MVSVLANSNGWGWRCCDELLIPGRNTFRDVERGTGVVVNARGVWRGMVVFGGGEGTEASAGFVEYGSWCCVIIAVV